MAGMRISGGPAVSNFIRSLCSQFLRGQLAKDISWLYCIHLLNYVVPLLLIPYLSRILGVTAWGILAFALSFGGFVGAITEYGFYVSAQREAARRQHDKQALARLFNEVLSAKLLIACLAVAVAFIGSRFIPILNEDPRLLLGSLFFGVTQAFSLTWYFRGIQRIKLAAGMEAAAKVLSAVLVVTLIKFPEDTWKYCFAFGAAHLSVLIWGLWRASRDISLHVPIFMHGVRALRDGRMIFFLHATGSAFTSSSVFIIGLLAPPQIVGYFAGAEKIVRILAGAMEPVRQAMFPRLSYLVQSQRQEARAQLTRVLVATGVISVILGCFVYLFAPELVRLVLGNEFSPAIDCLKVLAILVPVLTLNSGLGYLWMLPRGFERKSVLIIASALVVNITLAIALVPSLQHIGMAIVVVLSELLVVIGFWLTFSREKR